MTSGNADCHIFPSHKARIRLRATFEHVANCVAGCSLVLVAEFKLRLTDLRILIAHNSYQQFGGEDVVVANELALLQHAGHDTRLFQISNHQIKGLISRLRAFLNVSYSNRSKKLMTAAIEDFQPDIVHVHNFFPLLTPSIYDACIAAGVPVIQTLHNFRILCPTNYLLYEGHICERSIHKSAWWTVRKRVYRNSLLGSFALAYMVESHKRKNTWNTKISRLIALSEFAQQKFIEGGIDPEKLVVKPNYPDELVASFGEDRSERNGALFVGRMSAEKGVDIVVRAWEEINYPLRMVGAGPLLKRISEKAPPSVRFLGNVYRETVMNEMASARMLIMASTWYEMFPMVLVEAFAASLPAIVPRLGSMAAIVKEGETGLLFNPGDAADLAAKVHWAVAHPDEMRRMGARARLQFEQYYSAASNLEKLVSIYQSAIVEARSRATERKMVPPR